MRSKTVSFSDLRRAEANFTPSLIHTHRTGSREQQASNITMAEEELVYKRSLHLRPSLILTIVLIMALSWPNGILAGGCPENCHCSTRDGNANSRTVKCSYLNLSGIPEMLHATTVNTLDLSNNGISILINASFSSFSRLLTLILSSNEVEVIEINAFAGLGKMMDINLSYNNLQSLNPEIFFSNPELENVSLKGNPIVFLSSSSPILISNSVSSLDLSSCSVTTIHPETFSRLPKLYSLDLSSNFLQTISVSTFQNLPDLTILELNNNRWKCNCDVLEVMQWAESRREQHSAPKPVRCLEGQYRTLWTIARGNRSCRESKTTEPVVVRNREFTTGMAVDSRIMSVGIAPTLKTSPLTILQRDMKNEGKNDGDLVAVPGCETGGWASLLSWNVNTLMVFVILPFTLCGAVFVSLMAVNYIKKRCRNHHPQHHIQEKCNHVAAFSSSLPLLTTQLPTELRETQAGHENRSSDGYRGAVYHVYERID